MSDNDNRLLLVVGSGPGIGNHTASLFAQKRFNKIALIARNKDRLSQDKQTIEEAGKAVNRHPDVRTWALDVTDAERLKHALSEIEKFGQLECVFYNAARVAQSQFFEHPASDIRYDLEVTTIALYAVAGWAYPQLKQLASQASDALPTILVTNSSLPTEPHPAYFALSLTKAAQWNLVNSLKQFAENDGIHVTLISPWGPVSPELKERNPKNIADKAWETFIQKRNQWELETRIGVGE